MPLQLLIDNLSAGEWGAIGRNFADYNLYQTWAYAELRAKEDRVTVSRAVAMRDGRIMAMAQVRIKRIPVLRAGIAYVHRGPLWQREGARPQDLRDVVGILRREFVERRGLTLRIAPPISMDPSAASETLHAAGLVAAGPLPERTILLDLASPLVDLRRNLAQKWRNCLNYAERQGLSVTAEAAHEQMAAFEALYEQMWTRKRFESGVRVASFRDLQSQLPPGERLQVFIARDGDQPVAGHVSSTLGNTCVYLLGASNELGRRMKAAYLLQWRTIEHAVQLGARWYDLGGVDPVSNPGVYHFKSGLGGTEASYPRCYTTPRRGPARVLLPMAESIYRGIRRLQRQKEAVQA